MIVALDWQHQGKPYAPTDRGAAYDQDGDGIVTPHEHEVVFTGMDIIYAAASLRQLGHTVYVLSDGTYKQRAQRAAAYGARVYVAMHRNAGKGEYGFLGYDKHTRKGPDGLSGDVVAFHVARRLGAALPELSEVKRVACSATLARRAYSTIRHAPNGVIGLCFEPGFLDNPKHRRLTTGEGSRLIGHSLATGIDDAANAAAIA